LQYFTIKRLNVAEALQKTEYYCQSRDRESCFFLIFWANFFQQRVKWIIL